MDLNTLKSNAGIIRDATEAKENTATRVGSWLVNLIEYLTNTTVEAVMTGIAPAVTAEGIVLTLSFQKADGTTFTKTITLPLADAEKAGLMSPAMVAKFSAMQSSINAINTKNTEQDSAIATAQSDIASIKQTNATQDSRIDGIEAIAETASIAVETLGADVSIVKSNVATLQNNVAGNAFDIAAIQESIVSQRQKNAEQDTRINALAAIDENILVRLDEMQLVIDTLSQRVKALEN